MTQISFHKFKMLGNVAAATVALIALLSYWLTLEPGASLWDCPEFIAAGYKLEPNHPPGAPLYAIICRVAAIFAPSSSQVAYLVNFSSALFSALTVGILSLTIFRFSRPLLKIRRGVPVSLSNAVTSIGASSVGALIFAWSDTFWFSAVEAEVYALSVFITALTLWVMILWYDADSEPRKLRILILETYLIGLSIGVHQLNLLVIPALVMIMIYKKKENISPLKIVGAIFLSFLPIAFILFGMMPGIPDMIGKIELSAVNDHGMNYGSGIVIYAISLALLVAAMLIAASKGRSRIIIGLSFCAVALFILTPPFAIASIILISLLFIFHPPKRAALIVAAWGITMVIIGFSSYLVIPIRGAAHPPMNQGAPGNPFSFASYLDREQYGAHPLLFGPTPMAQNLREERFDADGNPDYQFYALKKGKAKIFPALAGATAVDRGGMLSDKEKEELKKFTSENPPSSDRYVVAGYRYSTIPQPELQAPFSRIFSSDADHIEAYQSWVGMTPERMDSVEVSFAIDSLGHPVGRLNPDSGKREKSIGLRPTLMQQLAFFLGYQTAYMYFRYLMWNFAGRQNDFSSQGQIDTGNFITGFPWIDNAMLGNQSLMPERRGSDSPGRNAYFLLPLMLGMVGILYLAASGKCGVRMLTVISLLFFMTGLAIAIYLNQTPCEPRERDYSFVGSFYAFAMWCGLGVIAVVKGSRKLAQRLHFFKINELATSLIAIALSLFIPVQMLSQNYDDHDRSHRFIATDWAVNTLESLEKDAIIFVSGDNFTFPLWYAREVLGVRPDVRVVNTTYLNTGWYPLQLMMQEYSSTPVEMTASPAQLAYGGFTSVIAPISSYPRPGVETLKELYASSGFGTPHILSSLLQADEFTIDLSAGKASGVITGDRLLMADIILTNAADGWKRPIYFSTITNPGSMLGLADFVARRGFVYRLFPEPVSENDDDESYRLFTSVYKYGGIGKNKPFIDEVNGDQVARLRREIFAAARRLAARGDKENAQKGVKLVHIGLDSLPPQSWGLTLYPYKGEIKSEALDAAQTLFDASRILRLPYLKEEGFKILIEESRKSRKFYDYYSSLRPGQRNVVSPAFRREAKMWFLPIEKYLKEGGSREKLPDEILKGIDIKKEREKLREVIDSQNNHDTINN